jgi:hypothetical protein
LVVSASKYPGLASLFSNTSFTTFIASSFGNTRFSIPLLPLGTFIVHQGSLVVAVPVGGVQVVVLVGVTIVAEPVPVMIDILVGTGAQKVAVTHRVETIPLFVSVKQMAVEVRVEVEGCVGVGVGEAVAVMMSTGAARGRAYDETPEARTAAAEAIVISLTIVILDMASKEEFVGRRKCSYEVV